VSKEPKDQAVSERLPVARVAVDISLAHLDRPFDYLVPARLDQAAVPGCRVRVRFAGQLVDGYLLERTETSEHEGKLARLERVTSPEPVLTPEIFDLARAVADRYAGTLADVLRLAIPPRHAAAERDTPQAGTSPAPVPGRPEPGSWRRYPAGAAFLAGLAEGRPVRAAWSALPGSGLPGSGHPGEAQPGLAQPGLAQPGLAQPGLSQRGPAQPGPALPSRPRSPSPPAPRPPRAAAWSSSCLMPATWTAWTRP
jgi:primosomal protein N'